MNASFSRPMVTGDLPLVREWLAREHVREWWGDPNEQFGLVSGDMNEPAIDQYIVSLDAAPLGYLQCYRLTIDYAGRTVWFDPAPTLPTCGGGARVVPAKR